MHPTLMMQFAEDRALDLRCSADARRRGRLARSRGQRRFKLHFPRRATQVAHA